MALANVLVEDSRNGPDASGQRHDGTLCRCDDDQMTEDEVFEGVLQFVSVGEYRDLRHEPIPPADELAKIAPSSQPGCASAVLHAGNPRVRRRSRCWPFRAASTVDPCLTCGCRPGRGGHRLSASCRRPGRPSPSVRRAAPGRPPGRSPACARPGVAAHSAKA
jgi:hypothetical protein